MLTMVLATGDADRPQAFHPCRRAWRGGAAMNRLRCATSYFKDLALVFHLRERLQHFDAELAVGARLALRLLDDLLGVLVEDNVAGIRVDPDSSARAVGGPALERLDDL